MAQIALYKNGNSLSYAEYGDKNGYPILIQHGLIASINDYSIFCICQAKRGPFANRKGDHLGHLAEGMTIEKGTI
jgi:hypothetical protein